MTTEQSANIGMVGLKRAASAWAPVLGYMALIFMLSAQPHLEPPTMFRVHDKLQHLAAYFAFGLIAFRGAILLPVVGRPGPYVQSLLLGALYGASDEYHQKFVAGRTASGLDWLADVAGVTAALVVICILRIRRTNGGRWFGKV